MVASFACIIGQKSGATADNFEMGPIRGTLVGRNGNLNTGFIWFARLPDDVPCH